MGYVEEKQEEQVERLVGDLQDENGDVRWNAVEALKKIGALDAVPALIQVLKDQNEDVRWIAARALEKIGTPEALKAVEEYESQQ